MPPRWLSLLIVLFWLATSAVFFLREYWPYFEPDAPPPFAIDLLEETKSSAAVSWQVLHGGSVILDARTSVEHNAKDNDFTLQATFRPPFDQRQPSRMLGVALEHMTSSYRVNPEGQLLGLEATVQANYVPPFSLVRPPAPIHAKANLHGSVAGGLFVGEYDVQIEGERVQTGKVSVPVSAQGSVLMPLHPVNQIRGLRPGQTWRVPVVDPLDDMLASLVPGGRKDPVYLRAKVLPETKAFFWNNQDWECLVIEYTGDDMSARTWVRRSDGLVLEQQVTKAGDTLTLRRKP
jgi:hypothetical protein